MDKNFTIGFVGLGLIGGSIAKTIKRVFPNYKIIGFDEDSGTLKEALKERIIDVIADDCGKILQTAAIFFYVLRYSIILNISRF